MTTTSDLRAAARWLGALLLTGCLLCGAAAAQTEPAATGPDRQSGPEPVPLDHVVAVVNRDVVTEFELQNRVRQTALNLRRQDVRLPPMENLRRQVLQRLILEKAMRQRADELGIRIDEQMVSASIDQIAKNNHLTTDELRDRLREDNIAWSAFREQIREDITRQRLREREVDSHIVIPESEVDAFLAEQAGFTSSDTTEYHVAHILLPFPGGDAERSATREVERLAEEIYRRAERGEDFAQLAVSYSKAPDALNGGDLGWRDPTRLPSVFWDSIARDPRAGHLDQIRQEQGIHIIKVLGVRDGVQAKIAAEPVQQTHVRHILMLASSVMSEAQVLERLALFKQRLASGEIDFATLARLNSADRSATRGGDLGWVQRGEVAPEFEAAMDALAPGEISDPVRSQFGYHLIQVLERRVQGVDSNRIRFIARQNLRERKLAEAVAQWERELYDQSYVEIREENL